ncbi:MAG TPA: metallophosphoesterase [Polyangia bacterium]|nr:metallophosphoesterase [Polyangia bacterium]
MRFVIFLAVSTLILGSLHYYVWTRLFRDPAWPAPWPRVGALVMAALCLSIPLGFLLLRRFRDAGWHALRALPFVWLGAAFLLLVVVASLDLLYLLARGVSALLAWWRSDAGPLDPGRRILVKRALAGAAAAATGGLTILAVRSARGEILTREVPVKLERLPRALDGLTLVQLSDLHVGLTIGRRFVESVVAEVARQRADAIVVTGDLVDGSVDELADLVAPLGALKARYGVFFIPGNHDYYAGIRPWLAQVQRMGWRILLNARTTLGDAGAEGASIDLAGVDDPTGRPDLGRALGGRDPERELVLLAHQPRAIREAAAAGVGLQLSGHTHGGQIWPFGLAVLAFQPYLAGLHRHGERTQIYVSRGTGYWGPPMRIGAPAEITRLVLTV